MRHRVPHGLDRPLAKQAAEAAVAHYQDTLGKYAPRVEWRDEWTADVTFHAAGRSFGGTVSVAADAIELEMDVPLLARPFQRRALELIEREVAKWVGRTKGGPGA